MMEPHGELREMVCAMVPARLPLLPAVIPVTARPCIHAPDKTRQRQRRPVMRSWPGQAEGAKEALRKAEKVCLLLFAHWKLVKP
jgi:hypothetical protein